MTRYLFIVMAGLLTLIAATAVRAGGKAVLLVCDLSSKEIILKTPLAYGQPFAIRYIHSVDHSPVFEVFTANKGEGLSL